MIARTIYIVKDLLLSQLSKFTLYADICFIVLVLSCDENLAIAWAAIALLGLNVFLEVFYIFK
jgi:hypothetical protein